MQAQDPDRPEDDDPAELLRELDRLRERPRSAGRSWWFPVTVFGAVLSLAAPIYAWEAAPVDDPSGFISPEVVTFAGLLSSRPLLVAGYWLVGLTAGFVLSGLWYRREAERVGLRRPVLAFLLTGGLTAVVLVVLGQMPFIGFFVMVVSARGTSAVVVVAVALIALARLERSTALTAIAVVFAGVTVLVSSYNVENLIADLGVPWGPWALTVAVLLPGVVLLVAGLGARALGGRSRSPVPV
jgi:hypothetical protein